MKTFTWLTIFIFTYSISVAQKTEMKLADDYFGKLQYLAASNTYEKVLQKDTANRIAKERLADCYKKLNNTEKLEYWLSQVCRTDNVDPRFVKMYAQVLSENSKYKESAEWFSKYTSLSKDDKSHKYAEAIGKLDAFYKDSSFYKVNSAKFNSDQADFAPMYYGRGVIFCSSRKNKRHSSEFKWDNSSFIDLYLVNDSIATPVEFSKLLNSELHEGPATFSKTQDTIYFTRNNYSQNKKGKSSEGIVKLKIYYAIKQNGKWKKEKEFELDNNEYTTSAPALAPDNTLYFTSDMPGGFGGLDIYKTRKQNGKWEMPVNLGSEINTSGNEMFPFVDSENNLYFASDNRPSLGGLDIFKTNRVGDGLSEVQNVGAPINSSKDDFGFIIRNNEGYFSSNRGANYKDDNIYHFIIDKAKIVNVAAISKTQKVVTNFKLDISDNRTLDGLNPGHNVEKSYPVSFNPDKEYKLKISKEGYLDREIILKNEEIQTYKANDTLKIVLDELLKNKTVLLELITVTKDKIEAGSIDLKNLSNGEIKKFTTSKDIPVSVELERGIAYELVGNKKDYKARTLKIEPAHLDTIQNNTTLQIVLTSVHTLFDNNEVGQLIEMDIKYDRNKFNIRADAAKELDRLVKHLNKNPNIKVELGSHTDSRGSDEANFILAQKRAESAVKYVVSKGISNSRLIPIGYGEKDLKVKDAQTEEEHEQNRRTTVKIVSNK